MKRFMCGLCLLFFLLLVPGCGEEVTELPPGEEDPALMEEGNPSAEDGGVEVDPAL